jgi:hypothetical protein
VRTPALAIGWAIWSQHRRGLAGCAVAFLVMAATYPFLFSFTRSPAAVFFSTVPLAGAFAFVLNSLLVVDESGSLSSRSPKHRFVFPARTHTLVFWPMLYAWIVAGSMWLVTGLIYTSSGFPTPLLLPALAIATLMVWVQALSWLPLPYSWIRDLVTLVVLGALAALPVWMIYSDWNSPVLIATVLIVYSAMAYPLGLAAVESDRRGEVWRFWPEKIERSGSTTTSATFSRRRPFRSADEAQFWYEWRCHGLVVPGMVGLVLFLTLLIFIQTAFTAHRPIYGAFLPGILTLLILMPVFMAGGAGPGVGRFAPMFAGNSRRFRAFVAIRPMTSGGLVSAKFRMAFVSVLLSWAVAACFPVLWVVLAGNVLGLVSLTRALFQPYANAKGLALMGLAAVLLPAFSWKQLTGGFAPTLTGRRWIADGVALAHLPIFLGLMGAGFWLVGHAEALPRVLAILPYVVVCAAILKGTVVIVTFQQALHRGLITWSTVGSVLGIWLALSACAFACVMLVSSTGPQALSTPIALLGILAFMPLSRFALATLAFDWSRHR